MFLPLTSWFHGLSPATAALCSLSSASYQPRYQFHPLLFDFLQMSPTGFARLLTLLKICINSDILYCIHTINLMKIKPDMIPILPIPYLSQHWKSLAGHLPLCRLWSPTTSLPKPQVSGLHSFWLPPQICFPKVHSAPAPLSVHRDSLMCFSGRITL